MSDQFTPGHIWEDGQVVTPDRLNRAVREAARLNGTLTTAMLANEAVTAAKVAPNAVTTAKIQDGAVTTDKIANDAVTAAKLAADTQPQKVLATYQESAGTLGVTINQGDWTVLPLNTLPIDETGSASVGSGAVTLPAGKYWFRVVAPNWRRLNTSAPLGMRGRLWNVTAAEAVAESTSLNIPNLEAVEGWKISGELELAEASALRIEARMQSSGFTGPAARQAPSNRGGAEIYAVAQFKKLVDVS